jgi:uncharacterized protein
LSISGEEPGEDLVPVPKREEVYDGVVIYEYEDFVVQEPSYIVVGLPDTGLVGAISVTHIASELGAIEVGGIDLPAMMPPMTLIRKGEPIPPIRLFLKDNVLLVLSEAPVPINYVYKLSKAIMEYSVKRRFKLLVSLTGIASPSRYRDEKPRAYWAASGREALEKALSLGIESFDEGILIGPYAVILKEASKYRLNTIVLLAESFMDIPDPEAAATVLKVFSDLTGLRIDTTKLLEEAELIRLRMRELMKQTTRTMSQMGKELEAKHPVIYT